MKRTSVTAEGTVGQMNRSDAWKIVEALSDNITWHVIQLDYPPSGKTGKFYRLYIPDNNSSVALCQWGARPDTSGSWWYGDRGQYKGTTAEKARELLRQKLDKGYRVVAEGIIQAPKDPVSRDIANRAFSHAHDNITPSRHPQWSGWRY
jgi:hypothetical protein